MLPRAKNSLIHSSLLGLMALFSLPAFANTTLGPKATTNPTNTAGNVEEYLPIRGQNEAFTTAAEVMSAYGGYFQSYGVFSDKNARQKAAQNIANCLNGLTNCDKQNLLTTLVNYNLGRRVRGMILENQTNAQNMKALQLPKDGLFRAAVGRKDNKDKDSDVGLRSRAESQQKGRKSFRFQVDSNFGVSQLAIQQKEILGDEFLRDYRLFMDSHLEVKEEDAGHFSRAKVENSGQGAVDVQERKEGQVQVDVAQYTAVAQAQKNQNIQKHVQEFKQELSKDKAPTLEVKGTTAEVKNWDNKFEYVALGGARLQDDKTQKLVNVNYMKDKNGAAVARDIATSINKQIDEQEKKRPPAPGGQKTQLSYNLSIGEFDKFLDEIWPPSASARKP